MCAVSIRNGFQLTVFKDEFCSHLQRKRVQKNIVLFFLFSAAACPLQVINGKDCVVEDSVTGNWFDLSKLQNGTFTAMDEKNKDNYTIKVSVFNN